MTYYEISQSPLYKLRSSRRLCMLLGINRAELNMLTAQNNYREYDLIDKNNPAKGSRHIEEPIGVRRRVHNRLQSLLSRIQSRDYLCSGKRGVSIRKNAERHQGNTHFLNLDIHKFYFSTRMEYIFRFFYHDLKIEPDVAQILSKICTCNGHIPTGSPLSQSLAFWSYIKLFDTLFEIASKEGLTYSLYVDDITFSAKQPINKIFHLRISYHLKRMGLRVKNKKIDYREACEAKIITGSIVSRDGQIRLPNKRRKKIIDYLSQSPCITEMNSNQLLYLISSIHSSQIVEPDFMVGTLDAANHAKLNLR